MPILRLRAGKSSTSQRGLRNSDAAKACRMSKSPSGSPIGEWSMKANRPDDHRLVVHCRRGPKTPPLLHHSTKSRRRCQGGKHHILRASKICENFRRWDARAASLTPASWSLPEHPSSFPTPSPRGVLRSSRFSPRCPKVAPRTGRQVRPGLTRSDKFRTTKERKEEAEFSAFCSCPSGFAVIIVSL